MQASEGILTPLVWPYNTDEKTMLAYHNRAASFERACYPASVDRTLWGTRVRTVRPADSEDTESPQSTEVSLLTHLVFH